MLKLVIIIIKLSNNKICLEKLKINYFESCKYCNNLYVNKYIWIFKNIYIIKVVK